MSKIDPSTLSDEQRKVLKALKDERDGRFHKEKKRYQIVIIILLIGVILLSLRDGRANKSEVLPPDLAAVVDEPNAYTVKDHQDQMGVALGYEDKVVYCVADNQVSFRYHNISSSTSEAVVQIIVYGSNESQYLLAQSGVIRPGYGVDTLEGRLDEKAELEPGSYSGVIRILYYNDNRAEEPFVKADIFVTIMVE